MRRDGPRRLRASVLLPMARLMDQRAWVLAIRWGTTGVVCPVLTCGSPYLEHLALGGCMLVTDAGVGSFARQCCFLRTLCVRQVRHGC